MDLGAVLLTVPPNPFSNLKDWDSY